VNVCQCLDAIDFLYVCFHMIGVLYDLIDRKFIIVVETCPVRTGILCFLSR
jgi:hypothetical protein